MNKKKYTGRAPALLLCLLLAAGALTACGNGRVVFTTGFGRDEVFRVGSQVCTLAEMRVYLTNAQNQYESVYGSRVWSVSRDGLSLEENLKENILAKTAQIKAMYLLAQDKGVELNPGESKLVKRAAEEYYNSLSDREKELLGVEPVILERMYTEYALADKVYRYIIQDINPEISDDEARTITVQHILFRTCTVDERGKRVELIWRLVRSGGRRRRIRLISWSLRGGTARMPRSPIPSARGRSTRYLKKPRFRWRRERSARWSRQRRAITLLSVSQPLTGRRRTQISL